MSSKQLKLYISGEEWVTIMNLAISEHDEIFNFGNYPLRTSI